MKKILIITYYWPPSGGAGVQRWVKFAKYLSRMGFDPYVLTVDPDYATYPQIDESLLNDIPKSVKVFYSKSFELYSLYKKVSSNKEIPYGGFANTKKLDFKEKVLRFIRGNFFLPDPRRGWNKYAIKKATEIITENNIDTIITTSPPHSTQLIGLKLKKKLKVKWIADLRDPWTDIYYYKELYPTTIAHALNQNNERKILNYSDKVITVSDDLKRLFSEKTQNIEDKISVIPNGFDTDDFSNAEIENSDAFFYISYVGTISNEYKIDGLINGIKLLPKDIVAKLRIRFIGKISAELIKKFEISGLQDNIETLGYVEHKKAINYLCSSNALLLIIPSVENNKGILTGKLFEYLASNRPILFIGPTKGDAAKIIEETESGIVCDYADSNKISKGINRLFAKKNAASNTHQNFSKRLKYSRESLTKKLIEII